MATNIIMPALEMAQTTGRLIKWLKDEGAAVNKGEPIMEIETDKVTVEIESPDSGILSGLLAHAGDTVPVGQTIAWLMAPGESILKDTSTPSGAAVFSRRAVEERGKLVPLPHPSTTREKISRSAQDASYQSQENQPVKVNASPVARKMAEEHGVELSRVKSNGGRIEKADVLAYLARTDSKSLQNPSSRKLASPKARRLASERNMDLSTLHGSGPNGVLIASDIPTSNFPSPITNPQLPITNAWRVMAERMTTSWTTAPHFFLTRDVNASRLIAWREQAQKRAAEKITYTDLLVKVVAAALAKHPRVNVSWVDNTLIQRDEINVGVAVAVEEGLIVPVIHRADQLGLGEIAARRNDLVRRAQAGKLRLEDIQGGTFTISNLGMYGVDSFQAIIHSPQAAILAVGRIAERVVPSGGVPVVQPMMTLSLSCDHRAIDGARGAQFLGALSELIEEPLGMLD